MSSVFKVFDDAETVLAICAKGAAEYTRKQLDELTEWVKRPQLGATGLIYARHNADGQEYFRAVLLELPKYFSKDMFSRIFRFYTHISLIDLLLFLDPLYAIVTKIIAATIYAAITTSDEPLSLLEAAIATSAQIPTSPNSLKFLLRIIITFNNPATTIIIIVHITSERPKPSQLFLVNNAAIFAINATDIQPL